MTGAVCVTNGTAVRQTDMLVDGGNNDSTDRFGFCHTGTGGHRERRPHVRGAPVRANLEAARALLREATPGRGDAAAEVAA